jgi:hypothetical protein
MVKKKSGSNVKSFANAQQTGSSHSNKRGNSLSGTNTSMSKKRPSNSPNRVLTKTTSAAKKAIQRTLAQTISHPSTSAQQSPIVGSKRNDSQEASLTKR